MKSGKVGLLSVVLGLGLSTSQGAQAASQAGGVPALADQVSALQTAGATLQNQVAALQKQVDALQSDLQSHPVAYTNYGPAVVISGSTPETKTVASVTLPAGNYTLSGTVFAADLVNIPLIPGVFQCRYESTDTVTQLVPSSCPGDFPACNGISLSPPMAFIGNITITHDFTPVSLVCSVNLIDEAGEFSAEVQGAMIATEVGMIIRYGP